MEGVPWPRPTILHAARRAAQGGSRYDDMVIRGRIGQAFGRLLRRADDFGQFVMLSPSFPSRLLSAFPAGTPIRRLRSEEPPSEPPSLLRNSSAVFCLKKKNKLQYHHTT